MRPTNAAGATSSPLGAWCLRKPGKGQITVSRKACFRLVTNHLAALLLWGLRSGTLRRRRATRCLGILEPWRGTRLTNPSAHAARSACCADRELCQTTPLPGARQSGAASSVRRTLLAGFCGNRCRLPHSKATAAPGLASWSKVHCRGALSGRQRTSRVPCRNRSPVTWS